MSEGKQNIKTERQLELLKKKIQELTTENQVLREINVKLQIDNFNLQKKLELRDLQIEEEQIEEVDEQPEKPNFYEVVYTNEVIENEEYLDEPQQEDEGMYEIQQEQIFKTEDSHVEQKSLKRRYSKEFDEKDNPIAKIPKEEVKYQFTIYNADSDENYVLGEEVDTTDVEVVQLSPKEAILYIYKLAAKRMILEKIKSIEQGKHRDSLFVSKILDLLFDKVTLANSTAQGQKCQSKLHLPAKPPLDLSKTELCMKAFMYRLSQEAIDEVEKQSRIKSFNKLVNDKIQNCRKCLMRTSTGATKSFEKSYET